MGEQAGERGIHAIDQGRQSDEQQPQEGQLLRWLVLLFVHARRRFELPASDDHLVVPLIDFSVHSVLLGRSVVES